jgi:2-phospho-L-lactate guanylyltransferase
MRTAAIVPIKRFVSAKQRLQEHVLAPTIRRALAEAMMCDVLIALRRARRVDDVLVVTGDPKAEPLAISYDATAVVRDDKDEGHVAAAQLGVRAAMDRGAKRVLLVAGDCPLLDPAEVDELLTRVNGAPEVVVIPDRDGSGTNGLLLTPPDVIVPSFGDGSRERHLGIAREAGARVEVAQVSSMALDIDRPEDLDELLAQLSFGRGRAAMTRGLLTQHGRL